MARSRAVMNASVAGGIVSVSALLPAPVFTVRRDRGHTPAPGPDLVRTPLTASQELAGHSDGPAENP
jgi:hypothetical protein